MTSKEVISVSHAGMVEDIKANHIEPVGTVRLISHNEIVLIPTPSPDPRGNISWKSNCELSNISKILLIFLNGRNGVY
jgi:hypothetical protein